jgi:hypothetical protein
MKRIFTIIMMTIILLSSPAFAQEEAAPEPSLSNAFGLKTVVADIIHIHQKDPGPAPPSPDYGEIN